MLEKESVSLIAGLKGDNIGGGLLFSLFFELLEYLLSRDFELLRFRLETRLISLPWQTLNGSRINAVRGGSQEQDGK